MKRVYLFLFIFSLIINIFQYKNDSKMLEAKEQHIENLEKKLKQAQDSIQELHKKSNNPLSDTI